MTDWGWYSLGVLMGFFSGGAVWGIVGIEIHKQAVRDVRREQERKSA